MTAITLSRIHLIISSNISCTNSSREMPVDVDIVLPYWMGRLVLFFPVVCIPASVWVPVQNLAAFGWKYCNGLDQRIARQRPRKHGPTPSSRTTGLCNPFIGNGLVNTLLSRCNDITTTVDSCHVTDVFCRQQPTCQWTGWVAIKWHVFSVRRVHAASA
jgi:hypothetical protein